MGNQRGSILLLTLIVLAAMMFAAAALMKSSSVSSAVAGNVAFKEATVKAADHGIQAAIAFLTANADDNVAVANRYWPAQLTTDTYGFPTVVDWSKVAATTVSGYNVQYVIDRLCSVAAMTDPTVQCLFDQAATQGSNRVGSPTYSSSAAVFYRVTVRVVGPRATETFVQSTISK